jgi:hypothetical protein
VSTCSLEPPVLVLSTGGARTFVLFFSVRMAKINEACLAQGLTPAVRRSFRRRWAVVYYDMPFPRFSPGNYAPFVQIWHRRTKQAAALRRASHITARPLPKLSTRLGIIL